MKRILFLCGVILPLVAQESPGGESRSTAGQRPPMMAYDSSKEVTLAGTVAAVSSKSQGRGTMVFLTLTTSDQSYEIQVAPDQVLKAKNVTYAAGDVLTVLGAPGGPDGKLILARKITRGQEQLTLLDENGRPMGMGGPGGGAPPPEPR